MKNDKQLVLLIALALCSTSALADEPPDDNIVDEVLAEQGYSIADLEDMQHISDALMLRELVRETRESESGAAVLKYTEHHPFAPHIPPTHTYIEVKVVPLGEDRFLHYRRAMAGEEVQRREMEASSLSAGQMEIFLGVYARSAMKLGENLQEEMNNHVFGSLIAGLLGAYGSETVSHVIGEADETVGHEGDDNPCEAAIANISRNTSGVVNSALEDDNEFDVKPWTSVNPVHFMMGPACMAMFAADVFEEIDGPTSETKRQVIEDFRKALAEIKPVGIENVNGRPSFRLQLDDVNLEQSLAGVNHDATEPSYGMSGSEYANGATAASFHPASVQQLAIGNNQYAEREVKPAIFYYEEDGGTGLQPHVQRVQVKGGSSAAAAGTVAIHSIDLWIDAEYFVDRKLRMEGVMTENGQSRDVFMEQEWQDYRNVPNSTLYEPYKRVMRAGGILTEAQQAELAEAQTQLAQYEREMASMPAAERAMVESMMGGQIEQMRNMVSGGAIEIEVITTSIEINPDFHNPMYEEFAREMGAAPVNTGGDDSLLQVIQVDLSTLGYAPGNTKGVLDTMTQVAISQFQAESGLEVTGEPSTALAGALAAAVGRK